MKAIYNTKSLQRSPSHLWVGENGGLYSVTPQGNDGYTEHGTDVITNAKQQAMNDERRIGLISLAWLIVGTGIIILFFSLLI